jgi:FlaA1/EpsC-like NDP-sugar epimerase
MNEKTIENIFNRKLIKLKINFNIFKNKRILITGSEGSIGKKLSKKLKPHTKFIVGADISNDITKTKTINKFKKIEFDFIFHLAADKRADYGEVNPSKVTMLNIDSTTKILKLKSKKIILGSTCKAADPITSYGASKLITERIVLNAGGNITRFVNVFDTSASVTKIWKKLSRETAIPVTDCKRYFMFLEEAVNLLLFTASMKKGRYSYNRLKLVHMSDIAKKLYPGRKKKIIPLRFGDRPVEKLVGRYEKKQIISKDIIQIKDCWNV